MLTYRDTNTVYTQITQSQDSRSVRHHTDARLWVGPIPQNGRYALPLFYRDVQRLGSGVQSRVLQAHISNGRRVYQRHQRGYIINQQTVEEVGIRGFEGRQVHVFVDIRSSGVDHPHGSHTLRFQALHDMRDQARQVLVLSLQWSERCACSVQHHSIRASSKLTLIPGWFS